MSPGNEIKQAGLVSGVDAKKDEPHIELSRAIESMGEIVERLERLNSKIQGPYPQEGSSVCEDVNSISLHSLLQNGPEKIKDKVMKSHQIIDDITSLLFNR